ncbi:MAG: class C sortase [Clostridiaceae bacterium]
MKTKIIGLGLIIIGFILFLTPLTRGLLVEFNSTKHLIEIKKNMASVSSSVMSERIAEAQKFNAGSRMEDLVDPFIKPITEADKKPLEYLNPDEPFAMLSIPKIEVDLPIYLGASDWHLQMGAAQVSGTSLPIGGMGTRSVIAGHRGWMGIPFFRNLDKLKPGDTIVIEVLGKKLNYKIVDLQVIAPNDNDQLLPNPDKDMVTLLTCHPYMINNERLLVNAVFESEEKLEAGTGISESYVFSGNKYSLVSAATSAKSISGMTEVFGALPKSRQFTAMGVAAGWVVVLLLVLKWIGLVRRSIDKSSKK